MTEYEDDEPELARRRLCSGCVGEAYLRAEIERTGEKGACDYCENAGVTLSLGEIADHIGGAFERHYTVTATEPSSREYMMIKYSDYQWDREGEPAAYAIASAAEIDEGLAEDIRQVLADRHYDIEFAQIGEESPFDEEMHYSEKDPDDIELRENWRYFESNLKTEARFFSVAAEATLESVFRSLHDHRKDDGKPVVVEAGPGAELTGIYRARVFQSAERLEAALGRPDQELGPPPPALAAAGRMNARGIAVFYGATSPEVAIGEVRPTVGSRVAVARFEFLRPMRLLDVAALRSLYVEGSIFDPSYIGRLELARFLERLSNRFATPVMPDDEPLDYLPTQAIADYLASRIDPPLDGILYPSVQAEESNANIVLFHKSSRVEAIELAEGTQVKVYSGDYSDEGWEGSYSVWEETPATKAESHSDNDDFLSIQDVIYKHHHYRNDPREACLRINTDSIQVHYVSAARYTTHVHEVRRHKTEKK